MVTALGIGVWFSKAIVFAMAALFFGYLYIIPATLALAAFGESRDLYGFDTSRLIAQSFWAFFVIYAGLTLAGLQGLKPGRVVAVVLGPFALLDLVLFPIGLAVFLWALASLASIQ